MADLHQPLVERAQQGDQQAFETLLRQHDPGLRTLALRLLDNDGIDDVLQEAYLKAYRALPRTPLTDGSVGGWLYRIVYRACMDELRKRGRHSSVPLEHIAEPTEPGIGPEQVATERIRLSAALAKLSIEHRAAIILVDGLGFDYEAAARVLGIRRGTIASRLNHARATLRRLLDARGESASKL